MERDLTKGHERPTGSREDSIELETMDFQWPKCVLCFDFSPAAPSRPGVADSCMDSGLDSVVEREKGEGVEDIHKIWWR